MASEQQLDRSSSNPFRYIGAFADLGKAMPRRLEFQEVITHIQRNEVVSVLAPPQTGKTTFLYELRNRLRERAREVVYLNFEERGYRNLSEVEKDFASLAQEQCPSIQPGTEQTQGRPLAGFLQRLTCPGGLVWLIDELPPSGVAVDFLRSIRSYHSETRGMESIGSFHNFVFAGSIDLADLTLSHDPVISPFNIAEQVRLSDFEEQQVQEFIRRNAGHTFSDQAAKRIYTYTGGHPFLVQFLCYQLYNLDPAVVERKLENLTVLLNELAMEEATVIQTMVRRVWEDPNRPTGSPMFWPKFCMVNVTPLHWAVVS